MADKTTIFSLISNILFVILLLVDTHRINKLEEKVRDIEFWRDLVNDIIWDANRIMCSIGNRGKEDDKILHN